MVCEPFRAFVEKLVKVLSLEQLKVQFHCLYIPRKFFQSPCVTSFLVLVSREMERMSSPRTLFGCANIGKAYSTKAEVETLLETLKRGNVNHLDTAARYPPTSPGLSEKLLGEANAGDSMIVDTKILIHGDGSGTLKEEAIGQSIKQSYESLKLSKINVLYCHGPDKKTPIAEQAAAFDKYYREGKFKHVCGMNYHVSTCLHGRLARCFEFFH